MFFKKETGQEMRARINATLRADNKASLFANYLQQGENGFTRDTKVYFSERDLLINPSQRWGQ